MALLRGINLGPSRRIAMAELRDRLHRAGYADARTYVQSGNLVLSSELEPAALEATLHEQLADWFGLDVPIVVRTDVELADVVAANPLGEVAVNPKWHVVTFLSEEPEADAMAALAELAVEGERIEWRGREIYTWYPAGQARSKLAQGTTAPKLGVMATARNWATVTKLLEMARS